MKLSIFERDVTSQVIDIYGKTRIINFAFKNGVSLAVSPLPQIDIGEIQASEVYVASLSDALDFIASRELEITEIDGSEDKIQGIWVKSTLEPREIFFGYIPTEITDIVLNKYSFLKEYPHSTANDPLFVEGVSDLTKFKENSRIAEYLRVYSIWKWAQNPDEFNEACFRIIPDYKYDTEYSKSKIVEDSSFLQDGLIVVPDKETANRLVRYTLTQSLNNSALRSLKQHDLSIDTSIYFTDTEDFRTAPKQIIFFGRESIDRWKMEHLRKIKNATVAFRLDPDVKEPYYYRSRNIYNGDMIIIQNTKGGDLASALEVSYGWEAKNEESGNGSNIGWNFSSRTFSNGVYPPFEVHTSHGLTHRSTSLPKKGTEYLKVFGYDNGTYAGILKLKPLMHHITKYDEC